MAPNFRPLGLGFTRQSRSEDFLELSVWGIRGVEVGLGLHTDWVVDKKKGGDSPEPRVAVPSFSCSFFFFFLSHPNGLHVPVREEGKRLLGRCVLG